VRDRDVSKIVKTATLGTKRRVAHKLRMRDNGLTVALSQRRLLQRWSTYVCTLVYG